MNDWVERTVARRLERYRKQLAANEHDKSCEQRERSGLCHCRKREREAIGLTELPVIHFCAPECGLCGVEVEGNWDDFYCLSCGAKWKPGAGDGDRADSWGDDYGDDLVAPGNHRFGQRLIEIVREQATEGAECASTGLNPTSARIREPNSE